ncbi:MULTISPECIES: sensor histidine kinase [unclassified Frondihabitans]|uniref:sensor histidine kinase n=1 Tax=unclassified Frondihabitans TaxID=2626248 RepID=UPI000FC251BB|nr:MULTISPECIES: histidine kinase [unclassified Frondihabitans]RPE75283.1 signal transduction histidine kinase [Frondihabitans sp. PhB153]RPF04525.1 signal transduction histidine kinase [Frondihabitans sp. PhB161]
MIFRRLTSRQLAFDVAVAVVTTLVTLPFDYRANAFSLIITGGMVVALAFRRISPAAALSLAWATAAFEMLTLSTPQVSNLAICAVLYATAAYGSSRVKWLGLGSVGIGAALGMFYVTFARLALFGVPHDVTNATDLVQLLLQIGVTFLGFLALLGLPWVGGQLVRTRLAARESRDAQLIAEREALRAENDAARAAREAARAERDIAVEQERSRIARDMHDVVAHSLAVVIAQADGARYAYQADPTSVEQSLSTIAATARESLVEVRVLLGQLRHSQGAAPQPVLGDLEKLVDQMTAAGLSIDLRSSGTPGQLGSNRQLAIYRIVQESLTNVLRHGDRTSTVEVLFDWRPDDLIIVVASTMQPAAPIDPNALTSSGQFRPDERRGHGIVGMRERAILAGGTLTTHQAGGSFIVRATIPTAALTQEVRLR